jgi:hypothetical protein
MSKSEIAVMWIMHTPRGTFDFGYKAGEAPPTFDKPPVWMGKFRKQWHRPQDPVIFEFTLTDEQYAQDAFNYLYNGPAEGIKYPVQENNQSE